MQLSLQNFSTLVENMAAAVQGAARQVVDVTVGSVLRAILEANASLALWLQWLIVEVLATTRLATSNGADCDSFGADFGFSRLPPAAANGAVIFSRFTPSTAALIPLGTDVSTSNNTQSFTVSADSSNAAYNPALGGYILATGVASVTVPVMANLAGSAGNVQAGAISVLSSAVAGVDTVANAAALSGGFDGESDAAFRARFGNYLASLSRATNLAVYAAVAAVQQGISCMVSENMDQTGATQMGHFVVTVDDGSGNPANSLLSAVQMAVDVVRPVGSSFAVQGPVVLAANVSLSLTTAAGTSHQVAVAAVAASIEAYIASLPIGGILNYTRLAQLAYAASAAVNNVSSLTLNGAMSDLAPPQFGVVRLGTLAVS